MKSQSSATLGIILLTSGLGCDSPDSGGESPPALESSPTTNGDLPTRITIEGFARLAETAESRAGDAKRSGDLWFTPHPTRPRSIAQISPWPVGWIPYWLDGSWQGDSEEMLFRDRLEAGIDRFERQTEIRFFELPQPPTGFPGFGYVRIARLTSGISGAELGYGGGERRMTIAYNAGSGGIMHEFGHILGLIHEHQHPDRDNHIAYDDDCVDPVRRDADFGVVDFAATPNLFEKTAYDFRSLMQYPSEEGCANKVGDDCFKNGNDQCWPIVATDVANCPDWICTNEDGLSGQYITIQQDGFSAGDIDVIHRLYDGETTFPFEALENLFGVSAVAGDFNDDDVMDFAIGSPSFSPVFTAPALNSGRVDLFCGIVDGFTPCGSLDLNADRDAAVPSTVAPQPNDRFGASLAVADIDLDGADDLVVGAPGRSVTAGGTTFEGAGAVYVFRSRRHDTPQLWRQFTLADQPFGSLSPGEGDGFGESVAVGTAPKVTDSAPPAYIAVGAPRREVSGVPSGSVVVFRHEPDETLEYFVREVHQEHSDASATPLGTNGAGELFGRSVAFAQVDGALRTDLLVGAPCDDGTYSCEGAVYVYEVRSFPTYDFIPMRRVDQSIFSPGGAGNDYFGWSMATSDIDKDGYTDLVVGAPGHAFLRGRVRVIDLEPAGDDPVDTLVAQTPEPWDLYGWSLSVLEKNPEQILVGAPLARENSQWRGGVAQRHDLQLGVVQSIMEGTPAPFDQTGRAVLWLRKKGIFDVAYAVVTSPGLDPFNRGIARVFTWVAGQNDGEIELGLLQSFHLQREE